MKCKQTLKNNESCQAWAMKSSEYCFTHNPATAQEKHEAVKRGGSVKYERGLMPLEPIDFRDAKPILWLMADTINRVRRVQPDGMMDVKTANCIGQLSRVLLEAQKELSIVERIEQLEQQVERQAQR